MLTETSPRGAPPAVTDIRRARALLGVLLCAGLSGCGTSYVMQAASGQWHVSHERVPIDKVIEDPATGEELRQRLILVREARAFATDELQLPDNTSYRSYADIHRPYVVWNVVATPEFSVVPKHWCFPVAGCVAYRGYFHEASARKFALQLREQGYDVAVEGVPAYSTLGKFADPVLSSMMRYGDDELAATIFHELAHQKLYVKDDSAFNEAFATTVEEVGLERWLIHSGAAARIAALRTEEARERELMQVLAQARARLSTLYASQAPAAQLRTGKADILASLAAQIRELERRDGLSYPLYDDWIRTGLNNAHLASVATYYDCVPGFRRLLEKEGNDLPRFYAAAATLGQLPKSERHARLCGAGAAAQSE